MRPAKMIPATTARVPASDFLSQKTEIKVGQTVQASPESIDHRLEQLDHEWDIDRWYEVTIAVIVLTGVVMVPLVNQWWLALPAFGALSLLTHALFGWSVFLFLFRAMGVRTSTEIAHERYALKALRGDFKQFAAVISSDERDAISAFESEGGMAYGPSSPDASDPHIVKEALEAVQR